MPERRLAMVAAVVGTCVALLTACSSAGSAPATSANPPSATAPDDSATPTGKPPAASGSDWITFHRDNARTGVAPGVTRPARLGVAWRAHLDGAVYGQPLLVGSAVLAATENDSIYALSSADGHVLWRTSIGRPQPLPQLPCGNIDPLGITSTPAYDPVTGSLFVLGETAGRHHVLAALDAATGAVRWTRPAEPTAGVAADAQQRAALTAAFGRVYIPYGGLAGDCADYVGSVVAIPTTGNGNLLSYNVPTARNGGIWTPGGLAVTGQTLMAAVGNGAQTGGYDGSDSVLALTPGLKRSDFFAPTEWAADNAADLDLGSMSPAIVGDRVLIAGKRGTAYLLDLHHLGGIGGQVAQLPLCAAYGAAAVSGSTAYLPCRGGIRAVTVTATNVSTLWQGDPQSASDSPAVGGSAVWSIDDGAGVLYALDEGSGKTLAQVNVGKAPHFASPTLGSQHAYVGTMDGVTAVDISAS